MAIQLPVQSDGSGAVERAVVEVVFPKGLPPGAMGLLERRLESADGRVQWRVRQSCSPLDAITESTKVVLHFSERLPEGPWLTKVLFMFRSAGALGLPCRALRVAWSSDVDGQAWLSDLFEDIREALEMA